MTMSGSFKFSFFLNHCPWTMLYFVKRSSSYGITSTVHCNNEWYICKLLRNYYWSVFGLKEWVRINILNYVIFPAKIQISKPIDVPYIHVYVWFKDDKHVVWMWICLILKNISLLDRIWSLWLVRFAHSTTNFIFWLNRLIFSVSTNSHADNIYIQ